MKRVFISQPTYGKTDKEILADRDRIINALYNYGYSPNELFFLDSLILEEEPEDCNNCNNELFYLGKSIQIMASADLVVFGKGWKDACECMIEFRCAKNYGLSYICED